METGMGWGCELQPLHIKGKGIYDLIQEGNGGK